MIENKESNSKSLWIWITAFIIIIALIWFIISYTSVPPDDINNNNIKDSIEITN